MYNFKVISESLVMGTTLTSETFVRGQKHNIEAPKFKEKSGTTYNNIIESFKKTIDKECSKADTIALQLSGGKDSRTLLTIMNDMGIKPVCLTYSYDKTNPELAIATKLCKILNLKSKYIKIKPKMYIDNKSEKEIIRITKGNPNFNTMMLFNGLKDKMDYDVIFNGNLMTEIMDTREHHWYNGNPKVGIIKKVMANSIPLIKDYSNVMCDFRNRLNAMTTNELILMVNWRRILYLNLWKPTLNFVCPILDSDVLSEVFSLPMRKRINSNLTRTIIRKLNTKLYNIPCARSPLSLKYPLWVHQGYARIFGREGGKGFNIAKYIMENMDIMSLLDIDLDILDQNKIKYYINNNDLLKMRWGTIKRMRNLKVLVDNAENIC